jgi:hypothetical protein
MLEAVHPRDDHSAIETTSGLPHKVAPTRDSWCCHPLWTAPAAQSRTGVGNGLTDVLELPEPIQSAHGPQPAQHRLVEGHDRDFLRLGSKENQGLGADLVHQLSNPSSELRGANVRLFRSQQWSRHTPLIRRVGFGAGLPRCGPPPVG